MPAQDWIALLTPLTFVGDDAALVEALRAGHPGAAAVFYDRYAEQVRLTLRSILGPDEDIPDLLQEVFIRALDRIGKLREVDRLRSWLATMAVYVGRAQIRVRSRRRWLRVFSPERTRPRQLEQPRPTRGGRCARFTRSRSHADRSSVRPSCSGISTVTPLLEAAEACGISLATFKRRLSRAEERFRRPSFGGPDSRNG